MNNKWITEEAISALYFIEGQIQKTMTQKLGWTECLHDNPVDRLNSFLDYLEETYVIPTIQKQDDATTGSRGDRNWSGPLRSDREPDVQLKGHNYP